MKIASLEPFAARPAVDHESDLLLDEESHSGGVVEEVSGDLSLLGEDLGSSKDETKSGLQRFQSFLKKYRGDESGDGAGILPFETQRGKKQQVDPRVDKAIKAYGSLTNLEEHLLSLGRQYQKKA